MSCTDVRSLTPVVVFVPLAFLDGITGVFFRALAMTMVVSLLTSLALAVTLTPSLATWLLRAARTLRRAGSCCAVSFARTRCRCAPPSGIAG